MGSYQHLGVYEREKVFKGLQEGLSLRHIGRDLGRSHATIVREVNRNTAGSLYLPDRATRLYYQRRHAGRRLRLDADERLRRIVIKKLRMGWSPEQISGRLKRENGEHRISHEAIYQFIYSQGGQKRGLHKLLYDKQPRRRPRVRKRTSGGIPYMVLVRERDAAARERKEIGHWEADLMVFKYPHTKVVTTLVERKSRYTALMLNPGKFTSVVMRKLKQRIKDIPNHLIQTVTFDQGREFSRHYLLHRTGIKTYFCDAGKPWQKGTVENTNKRLRRFLPKRFDPTSLTPHSLALIARNMNQTPRKCLDYATPAEVLLQHHQQSGALRC
jgi:IS30 family transposase